MLGGDISNEIAPRIILIFEGLVARLPDRAAAAKEQWYCRTRRWKKAVRMWEIEEITSKRMWDYSWRQHIQIDIVTYKPEEFADALGEYLDQASLPYGHLWSATPTQMARAMASLVNVIAVFDPNPAHANLYGPRGRIITNPHVGPAWM